MKLHRTLVLLKKCMGEARWSTRYTTWSDKYELFRVLFRLRYAVEIKGRGVLPAKEKIYGYEVLGVSYNEILYLFREIFVNGQYQFECDKERPLIIDAGANIGMSILYFKRRFPRCTVVAFEANPSVFALLKENIERNKLGDVELYNMALSSRSEPIDFFIGGNSLMSSIDKNRNGGQLVKILPTRLSNHVKSRRFDFAKIDVEGSEFEILEDLSSNGLLTAIGYYLFEYHHNVKGTENSMSRFLKVFEDAGFRYSIRTSYEAIGEFQDIEIRFLSPNYYKADGRG